MLWGLFLLIAAVWAVFLIPPLWADRRSFLLEAGRRSAWAHASVSSPTDTYRSPPDSRGSMTQRSTGSRVLVRRKRVLIGLGIAVIASLAAILTIGGSTFVTIHVLVDLALFWYVVTLRGIAVRRQTARLAERVDEQADEALYDSRVKVVHSR